MVTINYEPLEHLPYIDENISPEERSNVENLISLELANQFNNNVNTITHNASLQQQQEQLPIPATLHPLVDQLLPLHSNLQQRSTIMDMTLQHYDEESDDEDDEGIDLDKYTQFNITSPLEDQGASSSSSSAAGNIDYTNLYTTLGHSSLQQRNLELLIQNRNDLHQLQQQELARLDELNNELTKNISNKRSMIDDASTTRKRRQLNEYQPAQQHLEHQWRESINATIESTIETVKNS
ncbi:hypothetical protein Cantr_02663 [Candida viswanathii]|uniref:Pre-mRNA-splicing factor SPF27 n=1 Tax=Candida viswanathii TaxID=5486 RepID=A0A367YMS5_9ASCO|nr:hypothetical protein Cantr_02663 [Candida viswanathii]